MLLYSTLITRYGYKPSNIWVIYSACQGELCRRAYHVNYSATVENLQIVFDEVRAKMAHTESNTLLIFTTDHGAGFWTTDPYEEYLRGGRIDTNGDEPFTDYIHESDYGKDFNGDGQIDSGIRFDQGLYLWNETIMYDDEFADLLTPLEGHYQNLIVVMTQCFSGGFINDLSHANRIILTSCSSLEPAWAADSEGPLNYNEFFYHFFSAINRRTPEGRFVDADTDDNGLISILEAFNYASNHDSRHETPLYDDNGDGVGVPAPVPQGGDGSKGATTYL